MAMVLAVSLVVLVAVPERFADVSIFLLLDFLLLCLIVPYAIERGRERAHRDRALVTAARLETELVRKHLQPHFLMNTLTALSEWVDDDPRVAGEMIGVLAEELRLLHDILDRPLITMDEELRLCRAHLAIMSRRKGRAYRLVTSGVDARAAIPPAVFHTLVENAVTHGATLPASVELGLTGTPLGDRVRYVFEAPLGSPPPVRRAEGTGTRYIRARLHESFGARWTFAAGAVGGVWRTEIEIPSRPT
jgi:LytS/YehU family sensor histidine kinase